MASHPFVYWHSKHLVSLQARTRPSVQAELCGRKLLIDPCVSNILCPHKLMQGLASVSVQAEVDLRSISLESSAVRS
jgi:hypothetical protein